MQIIDFHTHIYPDAIAGKASKSIRDFYTLGDEPIEGSAAELLRRGIAGGIHRFVVLPVGMRPDHVRSVNEFILRAVQQEPRFTGFGTVHAAMKDLEEEAQWLLESPLKGVKMHPDFQEFAIDDPRLFPAYDLLQGKKPVMFHTGDPRYDYSHPERIVKVLKQFPRLQIIAAHFGGYSMYETAFQILRDTECVFDVSSSLMFMGEGVAEKYIRGFGPERMLFGSDFPLWDPAVEVQRFLSLKLTPAEQEQIAFKTAKRILQEEP